ncbi:MAG: glycosyltransferase family 2 protein [Deltaproteobacteria bacterium]|nr:glycosyltransferase family 2 protein [Deltaproteobacteria bacterium]
MLSVLIPVFNEAENVAAIARHVEAAIVESGMAGEILLVDDGSTDATWREITNLHSTRCTLRGLRLSRNFGKEAAISAGLDACRGDAVIVIDGDGQHPPSCIPEMVEKWRTGADVVQGIKVDRGDSAVSRWRAEVFYGVFRRFAGLDLRGASDFKLLDRRVVQVLRQMPERATFFRGMTSWVGFRQDRVDYHVAARGAGSSKWSLLKLAGLAVTALTSYSALPLRLASLVGVLFLLFAVVLGAQTLYVYLSGQALSGFATVILLTLIASSLVLLSLGIIGEYLGRIYDEVKARPRYLVAEGWELGGDDKDGA